MRQRGPHGFTLVEILTVIAILGILAGLLFPVLARAKESSRRTACLSNLKQLGAGLQMYLDAWDGGYPFAGVARQPRGWVLCPNDFVIDVKGGGLFPYVRAEAVYLCPSDSPWNQTRHHSPTLLSYSLNDEFFTHGDQTHLEDNPVNQESVAEPAATVLLMEENERESDSGSGLNDGTFWPRDFTDCPADRHLGGGNWLFADLHTRWLPAGRVMRCGHGPDSHGPDYYMFFLDLATRERARNHLPL